MGYADPQFQDRDELVFSNITGIASGAMVKYQNFQRRKLIAIAAFIGTAGTNASAGVDIYAGTTSIGALTVGTTTAGTTVTGTFAADTIVGDNTLLEIRGKANSATMVLGLNLLTQPLPDGTVAQ